MRAWNLLILLLGLARPTAAQNAPTRHALEEFGYRHLVVLFGHDSVDVLVQSKKGEEHLKKPLLLWCQGSLPTPLVLVDSLGPLRVFPFATRTGADSLVARCHLAIIGKPGIPLVAAFAELDDNGSYVNKKTRIPPLAYCQRNYVEYYVRRNTAVLRYLKKQPWVAAGNITVGGHSAGSTIAAHLAAVPGLVTRAVYLSGNPLGRMLSILADNRQQEAVGDTAVVRQTFAWWRDVVANPTGTDCTPGDDNRNTYGFSQPPMPELLRAKVPVFIGYGTRDKAVLSNDYLRLETMRLHKTNLTFRSYPGREHNFFHLKPDGKPNYDDDYWPVVGRGFLRWAGLLAPAPTQPH